MSEETTSADPARRRRRRRRKRSGSAGATSAPAPQQSSNNPRPRSRDGGGSRGGHQGGGGGGGGGQPQQRRPKTPNEKFGGREPRASESDWDDSVLPLNALELFCTYYLGITADNGFRKPVMREVARRFDRSPQEIDDALKACGMSPDILKKIGYDMSLAQLDISVAPDGINKRELAKNLFEEFIAENPHFVDWSEQSEDEEDDDDDVDHDDDHDEEE